MEIAYHESNGTVTLYPKCVQHNWYYKGRPPMTTGCKECWEVYFFCQFAKTDKDKRLSTLDELESAINHAAEAVENGTWDFKLNEHPEVKIERVED